MRAVERQGDPATCGHPNTGSADVFVNDQGCTRVGVDTAGGLVLGIGGPRVLVNGAVISLQGDSIQPHGDGPHAAPKTANPSPNVFVDTRSEGHEEQQENNATPAPSPASATTRTPATMSTPAPGAGANALLKDKQSPGRVEGGVAASEAVARSHLEKARELKALAEQLGAAHHLPPAVILAMMSRESDFGQSLRRDGYDSGGVAFGVLQVDTRSFTPAGTDDPFSSAHVNQALNVLDGKIAEVRHDHPSWTDAEILAGGITAYNAGAGNANTRPNSDANWRRLDNNNPNVDYSADVWAQAAYYDREIWGR